MHNALTLFRILLKSSAIKLPKYEKQRMAYLSIGVLALCFLLIPCCLVVGFISYVMTEALTAAESPANGLLAEIHIMAAFSMVFGLLVIFNILFFSSDREHLVPLPFKSNEILAAKFAYAYWAESAMEFMILLSMFIGFFISYGWHPLDILTGCIAVFLIPLQPMAYCAIISLLVMTLLRKVKSAAVFNHMSTLIFFLFIALFLLSFQDMSSITVENYVESLANNSNLFVVILNKIFFAVPFLVYSLEHHSILALLLYILANAFSVGILFLLGRFLYQSGLYTAGTLGSAKKSAASINRSIVSHSPFYTCLKKEFLVLLRTRAYLINCVLVNFLWPLMTVVALYIWRSNQTLFRFVLLYRLRYEKTYITIALGVVIVTFLATAMNSLASTAFTREGAHLSLIKYIPVHYKIQLRAKAAVSILLTFPAMLICIAIIGRTIKIAPAWYVYYGFLSLAVIVLTTVIGLVLDSTHPYGSWDDEYSALRGNLNCFLDMALVMVIAAVVVGGSFLIYEYTPITLTEFHVFLALLLGVSAILAVVHGEERIVENMKRL